MTSQKKIIIYVMTVQTGFIYQDKEKEKQRGGGYFKKNLQTLF